MIEEYFYLGQVKRPEVRDSISLVLVQPLYEEDMETYSWRRLEHDEIRQKFPNQGLVAWLNPPSEAAVGTVWQFKVTAQRSFDPRKIYHNAYRFASSPVPVAPSEVIDIQDTGSNEDAIKLMILDGLRLYFTPSHRVYLQIDRQTWVGPVQMQVSPSDSTLWFLNSKECEHLLPMVAPIENEIIEVKIDDVRWFLAPGARIGKSLGSLDWRTDEAILTSVLSLAQDKHTHAYGLTQKIIDEITKDLHIDNVPVIDLKLETQRLQRAQKIVATLEKRHDLVQALRADLLKVSSIAALIDKAKQAARQETEAYVHEELAALKAKTHAEIETAKTEEQQIQGRIITKQLEVDNIEREIVAKKTALASQADLLDVTVTERLLDIMAQPERVLADVAIIRAALNLSSLAKTSSVSTSPSVPAHNGHMQTEPSDLTRHTLSWAPLQNEQPLTTLDDVHKTLRRAFREQRLSIPLAFCLHATFLAGAMPIVAGDDAFDILKTYASCVTGGRLLWVPISPTMLEPTDLLGKVDVTSKRLVPHQSGLLDLLLDAACHPNELYMLVLDGINRAAIDSYLMPILACYRDRWQSERKRTLSLFHPNAIAADDPYARASQLSWPQNILLAGILAEGATVIAPPASLWSMATLLLPDLKEFNGVNVKGFPMQPPQTSTLASSISLDIWHIWYDEVCKNGCVLQFEPLEMLHDEGFILCREGQLLCMKLYAAMQRCDENTASKFLIYQSLIPQAVVSHQEGILGQVLDHEDVERFDTAVEMVREVLM